MHFSTQFLVLAFDLFASNPIKGLSYRQSTLPHIETNNLTLSKHWIHYNLKVFGVRRPIWVTSASIGHPEVLVNMRTYRASHDLAVAISVWVQRIKYTWSWWGHRSFVFTLLTFGSFWSKPTFAILGGYGELL